MPKLFDVHSHLNFPDYKDGQEKVISRMKENDIWTICVGTDEKTSKECIDLAEKHEGIFASVGIHPTSAEGGPASGWDNGFYKKIAQHPKVVAIGECGIDMFRREKTDLDRQTNIFKKHIELAIELDLPLIVHCRDSHNEVLNTLEQYKCDKLTGHIHFFSGTLEEAKKYIDLGFLISFTGVITFTKDYDEIIKAIPFNKIMIETDSPFVAPIPYRRNRNEPLHVQEVAKRIAEIRNISYEEVCVTTTNNALELFKCIK